jgi:hypothetical protein
MLQERLSATAKMLEADQDTEALLLVGYCSVHVWLSQHRKQRQQLLLLLLLLLRVVTTRYDIVPSACALCSCRPLMSCLHAAGLGQGRLSSTSSSR